MTWFFYQIFVKTFISGIHIHALFNEKSKKSVRGRYKMPQIPTKKAKRIWVHCASLGEFEQARPLIEQCKDEGFEVILSFFSPSGYEMKKHYKKANWVTYLPFDTRKNARKFIDQVQPDLALFVKYEFWWNFIHELIEKKVPTLFISVVLRNEHYLFKDWAKPFLNLLKKVERIYLIDQSSYQQLESRGFENIYQSSDTRIESVKKRKEKNITDETIRKFVNDDPTIIFGSTYAIEHDHLIEIADRLISSYKLLIFPHDIHQRELIEMKQSMGKHCMLYSELKAHHFLTDYQILIVDKIGLLKDAYRFARMAYVGGGLTHGLHNTLEPFVYKIPLIFGPKYEKFPEARLFAKQPFTRVIIGIEELEGAITELSSIKTEESIENIYSIIFDGQGNASSQIITDIKHLL